MFRSKLRLHAEPEALHNLWNSVKNAAKRSGLQGSVLLGTLMSNVSHGPFGSGACALNKQRAAEVLAERMTPDEFASLQESMRADRDCEEDAEIPHAPEDLPRLRAVTSLGQFAPGSAAYCSFPC